jgi:acyl-CoA reductase-like NAD-dependent aldehyde dehydrogenase
LRRNGPWCYAPPQPAGYKQSGIGRLRGPLAITEFQEAKTVVHAIAPFQG